VLELLQRTARDGRGVVMVTHNEVAAGIADRVIRMRDGAIVADEFNTAPVDAALVEW
jgi:putative ABC transport system ATP-binding protein